MAGGFLAASESKCRSDGENRKHRNGGGGFAEYRNVMSNLHRRLKKLEALLTDDAGLVPGSPNWLANWTERVDRILNGQDEVKGRLIPLEVVDAILETAAQALAYELTAPKVTASRS